MGKGKKHARCWPQKIGRSIKEGIPTTNFFEELNLFLIRAVNQKISQKQKLQLQNLTEYSSFRVNLEENIVLSTNWRSVLDNQPLELPTQEDIERIKTLSNDDLMRDIVILNHALSDCIDNFEESKPKTQIIHAYYRLLKQEVAHRPSLDFYPKEDGYQEYLEDRTDRLATSQQLERARETGEVCIFCGSTNVRSYNSEKWKCYTCGKQFRKRLS
jgi:hypothetical protein